MRKKTWLVGCLSIIVLAASASAPRAESSNLSEERPYMQATQAKIQALVRSELNKLPPYTPKVWTGEYFAKRHTPIVYTSAPWDEGDECWIEVPEYVWAEVPGDPHKGSPFYYGRQIGTNKEWTMRYSSEEEPVWRKIEGGGLALDNPLEGGYTVRFRVIPCDRIIEVRLGITNDSGKPLRNVRCQLCMMPHKIKSLTERWPTSSRMLAGGEVISWDAAGQDLSWLNPHRKPDGSFSQSCFFLAPVKGHVPADWDKQNRRYGSVMWLDEVVDIPAVAKSDKQESRSLIVYSPFGRNAFYNCLVPCFHSDPHMNLVPPGETRWTTSYYLMYNGNLKSFLLKLAGLHEEVQRQEGVPE